ncbi:MAG: hypothetical protein HEEMFOPI_01572 [Holosporales bacterium]
MNFTLRKYILLNVSFIFFVVFFISTSFSVYNYKMTLEKFGSDYIYKNTEIMLEEIEDHYKTAFSQFDIIQYLGELSLRSDHLELFEQTSPLKNAEDAKAKLFLLSLKFFGMITNFYIASANGSFLQYRTISDFDHFQLDPNKRIPANTDYILRLISKQSDDTYPNESWLYFSNDKTLITQEDIPQSVYQPTRRPWYTQAAASDQINVSDVYAYGTVKTLVQTISKRITDDKGTVLGVIGLDLDIRKLSIFLNAKKITKNARYYIVNDKKEVIATSDLNMPTYFTNEKVRIVDVDELNDIPLWPALKTFDLKKENTFYLDIQGSTFMCCVSTFSDNFFKITKKNWNLVVLTPEADLLEDFLASQSLYVIILLVNFIILFVSIVLIARKLSVPIEDLKDDAKAIKRFDFSHESLFSSKVKELKDLSHIIQMMRFSLQSFSKYVPKNLVLKLMSKNQEIKLGGDAKKITILFSDIVNFSTISEGLSAQNLMEHISDYFDKLTQIIIKNQGTVDKYIGDSIMAFWGAPEDDDLQMYNACKTALLCQSEIEQMNKAWQEAHKPKLETRIGLHFGEAIVGNMGSTDRMNYTIIGDNVNLASRLEGINKYYGTKIIVSDAIYQALNQQFLMRPLDIVAVKGKTKGIKIYELIGLMDDEALMPTPEQIEFVKTFNKIFDFYLHMNFDQALKMLYALKEKALYEATIDVYIERCLHYKENPPHEDWDGVYILTEK